MQTQSPEILRRNRFASIRASLQQSPLLKKNTLNIETKLEKRKKRKQSLKNEDENITQSQINLLIEKENQSVKVMSKFSEKYQLGQKIGEGSNGFVRKCYLKATGQLFAVKTIMLDDEHIMFLKQNFKSIKALDHPNIIRYHIMYLEIRKNVCLLVMDYNQSPNLLKFCNLPQEEIKHVTYQLINTLAYIHSQNICHRDIKPQNILYDREKKKITIIDFGISKKIVERGTKKQMLTITGTLYYRAPQMFLGGGYDEKVDLWAAGITLYQMITGRTPFQSEYLSTTIENITRGELQFGQEVWSNYNKFAKDLVIRLLKKSSQRLNANEARKHFWFSSEEQQNQIDLTKSDIGKPKNYLQEEDMFMKEGNFDLKFERSLTNTRWSIGLPNQEETNGKGMKKNNRGILGKWLAQSDEEDVMVDLQSDEENNKESDGLQTSS